MAQSPLNRRQFVKTSLFTLATLPLLGYFRDALAGKKEAAKEAKVEPLPAGQTAVSETDNVAAAIGYKPNVKDIDYAKYPQRKKPAAKNQFCKGCALYTPVNGSWGKCQMLSSGLVSSNGWCGSFSKKS